MTTLRSKEHAERRAIGVEAPADGVEASADGVEALAIGVEAPTDGVEASPNGVGGPADGRSPQLMARGETELERGLAERLDGLADDRPTATLLAATMPIRALDPIALFAAAAEAGLEAALWLRPSEAASLVGIGRAWAIEAEGPARFREAEHAFDTLLRGASIDAPSDRTPGRPVLLGGLGFSGRRPAADDPWAPFGASSLVLPALLVSSDSTGTSLTASTVPGRDGMPPGRLERLWERLLARARRLQPGPGGMVARPVVSPLRTASEQPSRQAWNRIVGMYAGAVGRGRIDKVVLAREIELKAAVELDVANALRRLVASAPESTVFAFRRDGRTFLGATPERLVRTSGRRFETAAIAGTIRRGANAAEDESLAAQLMTSEKDREEQRIVVAAIRDLLAPVVSSLEIESRPSIMRLRYAQHLATRVSGTLPDGHGLLSIAALLHPTPAVGGEPRDVALALIDENEGFDRGWYAGPVGWLGADGDGELCVALRCGIVERGSAILFAGCGIVADSDPDAEWEESRIKLRAVVAALGIPAEEPG
jgi:isochorismate synthase